MEARSQRAPKKPLFKPPKYRAPEVYAVPDARTRIFTTKIDIWSFAAIMVELFTGTLIFPANTKTESSMRTIKSVLKISSVWQTPSIEPLMQVIRSERSSRSATSLDSEQTALLQALLTGLFVMQPDKRSDARRLQDHPFFKN